MGGLSTHAFPLSPFKFFTNPIELVLIILAFANIVDYNHVWTTKIV